MLFFEMVAEFDEALKYNGEEIEEKNCTSDFCVIIMKKMNDNYANNVFDESKNKVLPLVSEDSMTPKSFRLCAFYILDNEVVSSFDIIENEVVKYISKFVWYQFKTKISNLKITLSGTKFVNRYTGSDCVCGEISMAIDRIYETRRISNKSLILNDIHMDAIKNIDLLDDFSAELDRIGKNKFKSFHGHPVHYLIRYQDRNTIPNKLIDTLYKNNRIVTKCVVRNINAVDLNNFDIERLYSVNTGGTLIFNVNKIENVDSNTDSRVRDVVSIVNINKILSLSEEYSPSVLTIITLNDLSDKDKLLEMARDNKVIFMPLLPKNVNKEKAMSYLNISAKKDGFKGGFTSKLTETVYTPTDIENIYSDWKKRYLIKAMGYNKTKGSNLNKALTFDPMERLNSMIGLGNVKETVNQIISYFKMQKVYLEKGITTSTPCRHMVFYGNPGTAKTTVARLLANILKQADIITNGKLVEVGRAELVAAYVGQTALKVRHRIKEAKGGILFIDEAYSLVDNHNGGYGEEAINTLVKEMDSIREDTIIILAGYPDKMEQFMDTNPGIRSRIGFHVKFDNYNKDELMQILRNLAAKEKFTLTSEALELAEKQIDTAMYTKDFGNGRFVRTLLEQAIMKQATRISKDNKYVNMDTDSILRIESEDISSMNKALEKNKLGFGI